MELSQLFRRFLKENNIYYAYSDGRMSGIKGTYFLSSDEHLSKKIYVYGGLYDFFRITAGCLSMFKGHANTPKRRSLYRLNKKWKDFLKNTYVQHNLSVGDEVKLCSYQKMEFLVKEIKNNGFVTVCSNNRLYNNDSFNIPIYAIESKVKGNLIKNYYINDGENTYGKIDGEFNEIQLQ